MRRCRGRQKKFRGSASSDEIRRLTNCYVVNDNSPAKKYVGDESGCWYSPSPMISISILGLRSQNAYVKAKSEVSPKHVLI